MKRHKSYKLSFEDESRLENVISHRAPLWRWGLMVAGAALVMFLAVFIIISLTPVRRLLPGYLPDSERSATEMQILRLDSLRSVYDSNAAYFQNILNILDGVPQPLDTARSLSPTSPLEAEALPGATPEEIRFMAQMREKEKYSISVTAQLAAESLMFTMPNSESVFTEKSKNATRGEIVMGKGSTVSAIADGTVIAVSQSFREGGTSILIQHPKGFLSRCNRLGPALVEPGDKVSGGQVIALANTGNARRGDIISIEMWRDGNPLVPYQYIGDPDPENHYPVIDRETGRGKL